MMSSEGALDWGLEPLPTPASLPFLSHLQLPPHPFDIEACGGSTSRGPCISLDLIEEPNVSGDVWASLFRHPPIFGLCDDLFSSSSIKSIRTLHYTSSIAQQTPNQLAQSQDASLATRSTSDSSSSLQSSDSATLSSSQSSISTSTSQATVASASVQSSRARHYSQSSRLSAQQHRLWWSTKSTSSQTSVNDPLKVAVAAEQRLYRESMKRMVLETCASNFSSFHPLVSHCVDSLLDSNKLQSTRYPSYYTFSGAPEHPFLDTRYTLAKQVSRVSRARVIGNVGVTFELPHIPSPFHSVTLPRSGEFWLSPGKTRTDLLNSNSSIPASASSLNSSPSASQQIGSPTEPISKLPTFLKQVQPSISFDANVRAILHKQHFPFVMSASTIIHIMNPSLDAQWEVPVRIEEVLDDRLQLRKVIFLDKPLVSRDMSIKQKNEKFYKLSLKRWLLQGRKTLRMDAQDTSPLKDVHSFVSPTHVIPMVDEGPDNLMYSEWHLDDMKLLVRGRVDGLTSVSRAPNVMHHAPTAIVSKMKHVPEHHLEEFSAYEKIKYLVKAHLLGEDSRLLVGHVDPVSARLVYVESLTGPQLRMPGSSSVETHFTPLYDVLNWMKTFAPGTYLLSHASGEQRLTMPTLYERKVDVTFSGGIAATYDLHERQRQSARSNLDTLEYLPPRWDFHRIHQIPNTFPPIGKSCCYDFIRSGKCSHPDTCTHLHISQLEADLRGLHTRQQSTTNHASTPSVSAVSSATLVSGTPAASPTTPSSLSSSSSSSQHQLDHVTTRSTELQTSKRKRKSQHRTAEPNKRPKHVEQ